MFSCQVYCKLCCKDLVLLLYLVLVSCLLLLQTQANTAPDPHLKLQILVFKKFYFVIALCIVLKSIRFSYKMFSLKDFIHLKRLTKLFR